LFFRQKNSHVIIYDSLSFGEASISTKKQIASICFCTEDEIKVSTADVQMLDIWQSMEQTVIFACYSSVNNFSSNWS
jgi:hypothetical protein